MSLARVLSCLSLVAALAGCKKSSPPAHPPAPPVQGPAEPSKPAPAEVLPFIDADYETARIAAGKAQKPLFIDAWAPWCHTCLSMKHYVLTDPLLKPLADKAVYLSLNTEKKENAAFLARFPVDGLPTFFVIDPDQQVVTGRWLGSGTADQMRQFIVDSSQGQASVGGEAVSGRDRSMAAGIRAAAARDYKGAVAAFQEALANDDLTWRRRPEALISLEQALYKLPDNGACVDLALAKGESTGWGSITSDFSSYALECADALEGSDPRKPKVRTWVAERLGKLTADAKAPLTADDRGDALAILAEAREALGDAAGHKAAHQARIALLDEAAAKAPDAEAASTYDGARAESYSALGQGDRAIQLLEDSERRLPGDYNPPARLARVLHKLGKDSEARAAIERALAKAYGPRKLGFYKLDAEILAALGDHAAVLATLEAEVKGYQDLPAGQAKPVGLADAQGRLAAAQGGGAGGGDGGH